MTDDWAPCPGCSREYLVSELCGCDSETGPLCGFCCESDHPVGTWGGSAA